ncbi:hypothetical protein [Pedobacter psychrotolerans]|uniref:hypothetical protein n=1 Tax=Pedobacter psychrotolerans TaxID=1843235 RepID=UPI00104C337A|nr:hypothetical protein [Pedobacter psychrotolerans]
MMEGEAVENQTTNFKHPTEPRQRKFGDSSSVLVLPKSGFRIAYPTSDPSLEFWLPFCQEKGKSPSAASRGKSARWPND